MIGALVALYTGLEALVGAASPSGSALLALASSDASDAAEAIEAGEGAEGLLLALREDADRIEKEGPRLGPLGARGIASLIRGALAALEAEA